MKKYLLITLFCIPSFCSALTLSDIESEIRRNTRDTSSVSGNQRVSDTLLDIFINEAQREFFNLTWCVETSTSRVLTAGTTFYALPNNFVAEKFVTFKTASSTTFELEGYSEKKQYQENPDFENNGSGQPDHYFIRYPGDSDNNLEISYLPVPTSTSTGTVKLWYYQYPADLSSDSDVPFDGYLHLYPYHYAIVSHVTARIKIIQALVDEATYYRQEFDRLVAIAKDRLGRSPGYSPSIKGGPR